MAIILQHVSVGSYVFGLQVVSWCPGVHCDMAKLVISHESTGNEVFSDEQDSK